jgi:hypothetical protein
VARRARVAILAVAAIVCMCVCAVCVCVCCVRTEALKEQERVSLKREDVYRKVKTKRTIRMEVVSKIKDALRQEARVAPEHD